MKKNYVKDSDPTGWPAQAKAIPPHVAETMTTTRSDINLNITHVKQEWAIQMLVTFHMNVESLPQV